jgi:hypothetical protein
MAIVADAEVYCRNNSRECDPGLGQIGHGRCYKGVHGAAFDALRLVMRPKSLSRYKVGRQQCFQLCRKLLDEPPLRANSRTRSAWRLACLHCDKYMALHHNLMHLMCLVFEIKIINPIFCELFYEKKTYSPLFRSGIFGSIVSIEQG